MIFLADCDLWMVAYHLSAVGTRINNLVLEEDALESVQL